MTHRRFAIRALLSAMTLLALASTSAGQATQPARRSGGPAQLDDVRIYLVLRDGSKLIGELDGFDKYVVRVRTPQGKVEAAKWSDFLPQGCYHLQKRLTDPNSAEVNYRLGAYCWSNNLRDVALDHFAKARRLDPAYAEKVKKTVTGQLSTRIELAVALIDPRELDELERLERVGPVTADNRVIKPKTVVKYQAFSPELQARAVERVRQFGKEINDRLGTKLRAVETEHFAVFTTWPSTEDRAVGEMFETIYSRLSAQFDIPVGENIYLGKLPVFCWSERAEFTRFAKEAHGYEVGPGTMAYVFANFSGFQQMNLYRYPNRILLEKIVAHECVHTFVNRYKSNVPLEMWLNEGLAEVLAANLVPRSRTIERARITVAAKSVNPLPLLKAGYAPMNGAMYPVAATLVDFLLRKSPGKFLDMVDRIKAGTETETAMDEAYGMNYEGLAGAWRKWIAAGFPDRPK